MGAGIELPFACRRSRGRVSEWRMREHQGLILPHTVTLLAPTVVVIRDWLSHYNLSCKVPTSLDFGLAAKIFRVVPIVRILPWWIFEIMRKWLAQSLETVCHHERIWLSSREASSTNCNWKAIETSPKCGR